MVSRYGRTKLGNILFARELVKRKLADTDNHILIMSVHPGTVATEVQGAWTESYGAFGKLLEMGSNLFGKSAAEGAEASLWAATSPDIFEGNWKDFQVRDPSTSERTGFKRPNVRATTIRSLTVSHIPSPSKRKTQSWRMRIGIYRRSSLRR